MRRVFSPREGAEQGESTSVVKMDRYTFGIYSSAFARLVDETTTWKRRQQRMHTPSLCVPEDLGVPEEQKFCAAILRRPFRCCF